MAISNWAELHGSAFDDAGVLVTGGAGFIGSHLTEALINLGARVVVVDDLSGSDLANLDAARSRAGERLRFVTGSILDVETLTGCADGCEYIFHQAAMPSVPRSIEDPVRSNDVNVTGTLNVLEAARRAKIRRVIYAASSSAYGDAPTLLKTETMRPQAKSPYAAAKLAGEHLMSAYASCYDIDTVCLRYFNIFGPRQTTSQYSGVIGIFARQLIRGEPVTIFGDGYSRDFTFVDNAVQANLLAARGAGPLAGTVINVGCGDGVTIRELALKMAELLGRADLEPTAGPDRPGDVKHSLADLKWARRAIGYEPVVGFAVGLESTVRWYQSVLGATTV